MVEIPSHESIIGPIDPNEPCREILDHIAQSAKQAVDAAVAETQEQSTHLNKRDEAVVAALMRQRRDQK